MREGWTGITYSVLMRRNATGEERLIPMGPKIDWHEASDYWWTDGNFGCDSNRVLVWTDWGRAEPEESISEMEPGKHYCFEGHFTVIKAILSDGTEVEIDGEPE